MVRPQQHRQIAASASAAAATAGAHSPARMLPRHSASNSKRGLVASLREKASEHAGLVKVTLFVLMALALWALTMSRWNVVGGGVAVTAKRDFDRAAGTQQGRSFGVSSPDRVAPPLVSRGSSFSASASLPPRIVPASIVARHPHDSGAFTQGLVFDPRGDFSSFSTSSSSIGPAGALWESTGLYGRGSLRLVDLASGKVLRHYDLREEDFGEGLALQGDQLVQLTWQNKRGYVYKADSTFTAGPVRTWAYEREGWGITSGQGDELVMSDGSATLFFLDPQSFEVRRELEVRRMQPDGRLRPVRMLNELEYIRGAIYANVWMTNWIVLIDPASGLVRKVIDARKLHPNPNNADMTLNGIAWDERNEKLYITGKLWPTLFEIEFVGLDDDTPDTPDVVNGA